MQRLILMKVKTKDTFYISKVFFRCENNTLEMKVLSGKHPKYQDILALAQILHCNFLSRAWSYKRVSPFRIITQWGRKRSFTHYIEYLRKVGDVVDMRKKQLIRVSSRGTVGSFRIFLPDLVELLKHIDFWGARHYDDWNHKRIVFKWHEQEREIYFRILPDLPTSRQELEEMGFQFPENCRW